MRRCLAVLATSVTLPLLASCSGGDTLTKDEFISQGDAVCARLQADSEALQQPTSEEGVGPFIREVLTLAEDARADFAALEPPEDGEPVQQALLDAFDASVATAERAAAAAEEGDTAAAGDLLTQAAEEGSAADQQVRDYGFTECGSEGG